MARHCSSSAIRCRGARREAGYILAGVSNEAQAREQRRRQRRGWAVRLYKLGAEPSDDLSGSTTPEERLEMMWPLAVAAWSLAGLPLPEYARHQIPVRCIRP